MGHAVVKAIGESRAALAAGNPREAFQILHTVAAFPAKMEETEWSPVLREFGKIVAGEPWASHFLSAADTPRDPKKLYELGYQLIEQRLPALAASVLARANDILPGVPNILVELSVAWEDIGLHGAIRDLLQKNLKVVESHPILQYLLGFNLLMTADIPGAKSWIDGLRQSAVEIPGDVMDQIAGMLARADGLQGKSSLDGMDLRGWQLVTTGSLLLHVSQEGFLEGMRGRYAFVQDSPQLCREGIARLEAVLAATATTVDRVYALPDRDSMILAAATAQILGKPLLAWPKSGADSPELVVAYDLSRSPPETWQSLKPHRPGQLLWSHATCWTEEGPFAPDITTFLYQFNTSPWGEGRLRADPVTRQLTPVAAEDGPVETLARQVTSVVLKSEELNDVDVLKRFAVAAKSISGPHAPGAFRYSGERRRQRVCSPVGSNRFG